MRPSSSAISRVGIHGKYLHPETTFVAAHVGESAEHLDRIASSLDTYPNCHDRHECPRGGTRTATVPRRHFFLRFADRILFGTDLLPDIAMYRLHFRFFETADEYFEYPSHAFRQGRWNIYGIALPDDVLTKIYRTNALRLLP